MQLQHRVVSLITVLAVVAGLAACNSKTPEPQAPARPSSDELNRSITAKIGSDPALAVYRIGVDADADKKTVTISGSVPTQGLRMKTVNAVKAVDATLTITDKIDVKPGDVERKDYNEDMAREARERAAQSSESIGDSLDDAWIHTKIRTKLVGEGEFPGGSLNVDVKDNVVTLRGTVATKADKTKAGQIAKDTDGVKRVTNRLVVKPTK